METGRGSPSARVSTPAGWCSPRTLGNPARIAGASGASRGRCGAASTHAGRYAQRRSTVPSTDGEPQFTGRDAELGAIERALRSGRVAVIHGPPGLGKSRLAMEYAHRHADAYLGGTFFVRFDQPPPTDLAKLL
jgi:hypothetical protein